MVVVFEATAEPSYVALLTGLGMSAPPATTHPDSTETGSDHSRISDPKIMVTRYRVYAAGVRVTV